MRKTETKIGSERGQSGLTTRLLRLFKADAGVHVSIIGQNEAPRDPREEIRNATFDADNAKAVALMEWQKSRRMPQVL
jgi:hypothetical protein